MDNIDQVQPPAAAAPGENGVAQQRDPQVQPAEPAAAESSAAGAAAAAAANGAGHAQPSSNVIGEASAAPDGSLASSLNGTNSHLPNGTGTASPRAAPALAINGHGHVDIKGKGKAVENSNGLAEAFGTEVAFAAGLLGSGTGTHGTESPVTPAAADLASAEVGPSALGSPAPKAVSPPRKPKPKPKPQTGKRFPLRQGLEKLIIQAQRKDPSCFFAEPVDTSVVPGYLDVIKHPMDFGTIRERVDRNEYADAATFERDVRLVVDNAMLFNPPETQYWQVAERISRWIGRAVERETELAITPAEEEEQKREEARRQEQERRNLAMGLTADGKPRRGGRKKQTAADIVPEGYIPAALQFGLPTDAGAAPGAGGSATPGADARDSGRQSLARDWSASRSVTPGRAAARRRMSASPAKGESDDEDGGSPADFDGDGTRSRRRSGRVGPRSSMSTARTARAARQAFPGLSGRVTASSIQDAMLAGAALPLRYLADGSIDASLIEDGAETLLSTVGADVLAPMLSAVTPLPREAVPHVSIRKNRVSGLEAALLTEPGDPRETYSHNLGALHEGLQHPAFSLPTHSAGLRKPGPVDPEAFSLPLRWPEVRAKKGDKDQAAGIATGSLAMQHDWTFNHARPVVSKLMGHEDVGPLATTIPAAAIRANGELVERHPALHGEGLRRAVRDELNAAATSGLAIPDAPMLPTDLTHLIWTNMYREYKPHLSNIVSRGVRGTTLLRNAVYGDALGEAYVNSVADFVAGAARDAAERPESDDEETEADVMPAAKVEEAEEPHMQQTTLNAESPRSRSRSREHTVPGDSEEPPLKRVKREDDDAMNGSASATPAAEEAEVKPAQAPLEPLDRPLCDWVREQVIDPLTGGYLKLMDEVAAGFRADEHDAAGPSQADRSEAARTSPEEVHDEAGLLDKVAAALQDVSGPSEASSQLDPILAQSLARSATHPDGQMRHSELKRLFGSRMDLAEFVVPPADLPPAGPTADVADVDKGEKLVKFGAAPGQAAPAGTTDERVVAALQQYGVLLNEISRRAREPDRRRLLDGIRAGLLHIAMTRAPPTDKLPLSKALTDYLSRMQTDAQSKAAAAPATAKSRSSSPAKTKA